VYQRVGDLFKFRALDAVVAKGMTKETGIFELVGASA
jgi:adenylate cyclase